MSVANREQLLQVTDTAVAEAVRFFTTPVPTSDPDEPALSVVEDFEAYMMAEQGRVGPCAQPGMIAYTVLGLLVAFRLLIRTGRELSLARALQLLLLELTPGQRQRLGMTGDLTGTRGATILAGSQPGAGATHTKNAKTAREKEYARLSKLFDAMMTPVDPSPFKKRKMTNAKRRAILTNEHHPERVIDNATMSKRQQRLLAVTNKVIAVSVLDTPCEGYEGDLAADETIIITLPARYGHGTRSDLKTSSDPDAEYWAGKGKTGADGTTTLKQDEEGKGHGYGITCLVRVGRPYKRAIPAICVGMHIGKPTGGRIPPVAAAHTQAAQYGLIPTKRGKRFIVDMGYSAKDDWPAFLVDSGYNQCVTYPANWRTEEVLDDVTPNGDKVSGPRLLSGHLLCPGSVGLAPLTPHNMAKGEETPEQMAERHTATQQLQALTMPTKTPLRPDLSNTGGRPKDGDPVETFAITVTCPAIAAQANCTNLDLARLPGRPDVPAPPFPNNPELRPRPCQQSHANYHLSTLQAKKLQSLVHTGPTPGATCSASPAPPTRGSTPSSKKTTAVAWATSGSRCAASPRRPSSPPWPSP